MIYVSPDGNDTWSGLQHVPNADETDGPLATLEKARNTIRELKRSGSLLQTEITVFIKSGTYTLPNTFLLTEQDSGTDQAPVIYRPFQQETVHLTTQSQSSSPLIETQNADHVIFDSLIIEHIQSEGFVIQGGNNVEIHNCHIHHIGGRAIRMSGGDRQTLTRCNHTITNNHIHNISETSSEPSIQMSGVGITVTNNHIHNCSDKAIHLSGNEHTIAYNNIHNMCLNAENTGAVYMAGDWTERGIRIQHNFFHDLNATAICLDDCASGSVIIGNIFARCTCAVLIGGGRNHRIENNIFSHNTCAIEIDGRGCDEDPKWRNLIYKTMKARFETMQPLESPYKERYPELRELAIYYQDEIGIPPEGNLIVRNICHNSKWLHTHWHANLKAIAIQNNVTQEDPLFTDPANDDYTLAEESPAYELGFKPIPTDKIGCEQ